MKQEKPRRLRWRMAVPLMTGFAFVWFCMVLLLFTVARQEAENTVSLNKLGAAEFLEQHWEYYQENLEKGFGAQAASILRGNLSSASMGRLDTLDGGVAFLVRDSQGTVIRSQLAWGYGHEAGVDQGQRWYLTLDEGLDDAGQIALARWIVEHRSGWTYAVFPPEAAGFSDDPSDGTYARVTGIQQPGYTISVQNIQLVHPDGTVETMVETATQGENPITLDLKFMQVMSVLLPSYRSDGTSGYTNMERRLQNFRAAQEKLSLVLEAGTGGSVWSGGTEGDGIALRYVTGVYQTLPYVLRTNWATYLLVLLLIAASALSLSVRLSKQVTRPTEELCRQAEEGHCQEDGPVQELNTLAHAFNAAQEQLSKQLQRERDFARAAAHELKTPLAVLRAHAEALREDIAPEKREQYLDVVLAESDRMAALVGHLLELSRPQAKGEPEPVDLTALVREVFAPLTLPLEQKKLRLQLELGEVSLSGAPTQLREAVENLASNALRYAAPGGVVRVTLQNMDARARLTVYNDGPNIPSEDLARLWEPFYRADPSRSRDSGGTGLGLAIVRKAVEAHGGRCWAENRPGGVAFVLELPM